MRAAHRRMWTRVDPRPVTDLARLFDLDREPRPGDPLPPLWHWAALSAWSALNEVGPDGHPRVGGFLPDVGKPRRMFAGGTVRFSGELTIGSHVEREDRVTSVTEKAGRSGDFVVVCVETTLRNSRGEKVLTETQNLIYRDAAPSVRTADRPGVSAQEAPGGRLLQRAGDEWSFRADSVALMRFSSATSNGHRIHYDWPYATAIEGYPGLVVHGPLMTLALAQAMSELGATPRAVTHRAVRPLFCGQPARVRSSATPEGLRLAMVGPDGAHSELDVIAH